jgi:hypothetical protein
MPNFAHWTQSCTTHSMNVDSNARFSDHDDDMGEDLGIDVPSWAIMRVPGNSTFDIQRAVACASACIRHVPLLRILDNWTCCSGIFYPSMDDVSEDSPCYGCTHGVSYLGSCLSDLPAIPAQALARQPHGMAKGLEAITPSYFS